MSKFDLLGNESLGDSSGDVNKRTVNNGQALQMLSLIIEKPDPVYWDSFWSRTFTVRLHVGTRVIDLHQTPEDDRVWTAQAQGWGPTVGDVISLECIYQDHRDSDMCTVNTVMAVAHSRQYRITLSRIGP